MSETIQSELALAVQGAGGQLANADEFNALVQNKTFLPRIQLMTANSKPVKRGEFPVNHFALINGDKTEDLGTSVEMLVLAQRSKALDMRDENNVISSYTPKVVDGVITDPVFKKIKEVADADSQSSCMYGPEYLVWLPGRKCFATFLFGSKSQRREAPSMSDRLLKGATATPRLVEWKTFTWFVASIAPCSTPIDPLPTVDEVKMEVHRFMNPEPTAGTPVEEAPAPAEDRAR